MLDHCHEFLYNNVEEMDRNTSIWKRTTDRIDYGSWDILHMRSHYGTWWALVKIIVEIISFHTNLPSVVSYSSLQIEYFTKDGLAKKFIAWGGLSEGVTDYVLCLVSGKPT